MNNVNLRVEISAELHRRLKVRAIDEGKTLTALVKEFLEAAAEKPAEQK